VGIGIREFAQYSEMEYDQAIVGVESLPCR
jgi:hypothetical protein